MENYSSKICTKCYSVQEPAARFCDNCGKAFAATAATDGNISIVTKTFLKRQVAETRPLFWLCIIIVGMLGVFGFAQAGLYLADAGTGAARVSQKPASLVSKDNAEQPRQQTVPMTREELAQPNDTLDLNESVFEMRARGPALTERAPRRKFSSPSIKSLQNKDDAVETDPLAADAKPEAAAPKVETSAAPKPADKPADSPSAVKKYIRGPMGGCYYISSSGSKRYVDRGLCS